MNRLERLSALLVKLQSRRTVTAGEIARQFGVSVRTVFRDIRALEESGVPVAGDAGNGYHLVDGFLLPPLTFTTEEALAFLLIEKAVGGQTGGDIQGLYRTGMDKIRSVLRSSDRVLLEETDEYVKVIETYCSPDAPEIPLLGPLFEAMRGRRTAEIVYYTPARDETNRREIEPVGLYYMINRWYLFAFCRLRGDYRHFNISRIRSCTPAGNDFGRKHPPFRKLITEIITENFPWTIRLKVRKEVLKNIEGQRHFQGFRGEEVFDGYSVLTFSVSSLDFFARWYLSFADRAEIIEPEELRAEVVRLLRRIRENTGEEI